MSVPLHLCLFLLVLLLPLSAGAATLVVANKSEASVSLHQLPDGAELARLPAGEGPHEVAVSPDGSLAVVSNYGTRDTPGNTLTVIDVVAAAVVRTISLAPESRPHGVEWLGADTVLVTAEGLSSLLLVEISSGKTLDTIAIDQQIAHMVASSASLGRAFVANIGSGTATAVDLSTRERIAQLDAGAGSEGVALVSRDRELWVTNREAGTVSVFATDSLEKLAEMAVPGFPIRVEADEARGLAYVTQPREDAMSAIDTRTREIVKRVEFKVEPDLTRKTLFGDMLPGSSIPVGVLLSGDGHTLFVAHSSAHLISVWDASSLEQTGVIATGLEPDGMDWSALDVTQ